MTRIVRRMALLLAILTIVGCGSVPGGQARAEAADGPFRLELIVPKTTWSPAETIEAQAVLTFAGPGGIDLGGSGGGLLFFSLAEVGGTRQMLAAQTADCGQHRLDAGVPMTSGLTKSGGFSADDPNAEFYRAFFADPAYRLPVGVWDLTAQASFVDEPDCSGTSYHLTATTRIRVTE